jgi:hypothetical protein
MANLRRVVRQLKKEQDRLTRELRGIGAALAAFGASYRTPMGGRGKISAAGRARIAAAQRLRWAKVKGQTGQVKSTIGLPKKRQMSVSARNEHRCGTEKTMGCVESETDRLSSYPFSYKLEGPLFHFETAGFLLSAVDGN